MQGKNAADLIARADAAVRCLVAATASDDGAARLDAATVHLQASTAADLLAEAMELMA